MRHKRAHATALNEAAIWVDDNNPQGRPVAQQARHEDWPEQYLAAFPDRGYILTEATSAGRTFRAVAALVGATPETALVVDFALCDYLDGVPCPWVGALEDWVDLVVEVTGAAVSVRLGDVWSGEFELVES